MKNIIAIDPGSNGGIAFKDELSHAVYPMPETRRDTINLLRGIVQTMPADYVAYIEKINGFIPMAGASMMFEFGKNVERVGCILETLGVPIIEVQPKVWQEFLHLGKSGRVKDAPDATPDGKKATKAFNARAKKEWKGKLKAEAQRRFPTCNVTLKTADALLILEYATACENGYKS